MEIRRFLNSYTSWIILINVVIFIISLAGIYFLGEEKFFSLFALQPASILAGKKLWTLLTSMFIHGGFAHLFFNMFSLFFIGSFIERLVGKKRYIIFYLLAGIFAGVFFAIVSILFGNSVMGAKIFGNPLIYGVGASGAIFGLLGLLAVLTPKNRVYLIAGPLVAIIIQSIIDAIGNVPFAGVISFILSAYVIFSIFAVFSFNPKIRKFSLALEMPFWILPIIAIVPLVVIGFFVNLPIGNMAHLGGLIAGILYGLYLRHRYPKKTSMISKFFSKNHG